MIISNTHRYVFVRCRKTASTSVETFLSRFLEKNDINTSFCERDERLRAAAGGIAPQNTALCGREVFYNHMPAHAIKGILDPKIWTTYYKFCFDRNPWDKAISLYFHRHRVEPRCSFDEFIASGEVLDCKNIGLYTIDGKVEVDFIGRYERLHEDLETVRLKLGLPAPVSLIAAKSQFRTDRRHYRDFLSTTQRDAIARLFQDEIEVLGYSY